MQTPRSSTDWLPIILSVFGTAASIGIGLLVYWLTKRGNRKALTYEVSATEVARTGFAGLELVYGGREVYAPSIVTVTISNLGKVPILNGILTDHFELSSAAE